jgi:glycosyltransferase involved in cell wall biosynthesis
MEDSKICCLVPAFNEAFTIPSVIQGALKYIKDIIVVDDGSEDSTGELARKAGAIVLRHTNNLGKGMALRI